MKILWVLNGCGLEGRGITGAPVRFHEVAKRFSEMGAEQLVMTTLGGREMLKSLGCQLPMEVIPASILLKREPWVGFRLWSYIVSALRWRTKGVASQLSGEGKDKWDCVISVSDYFCDTIPAAAIKRATGAKWVAWIHHCETEPTKRPGNRLVNEITYRIQRWSFKKIAAEADMAWINDTLAGDEIDSRLKSFAMNSERIRRMQNGIDFDIIESVGDSSQKEFDAVMVGARPNKGLFDIIPIWKRVCEYRPGTSLLLMGGMSAAEETIAEIKRLGLPVTVERGFLARADYFKRMKSARVMFAPSHEEGWGMAVGEAMACGLPVVAYDLAAYQKIYPAAYLSVKCFDQEEFAKKIVGIVDDAAQLSVVKSVGEAVVGKYSWKVIAENDLNSISLLTKRSKIMYNI